MTFIRPLIEYCSVVWDGCSFQDVEKLEKVQLYAARIITGLPILFSIESLYLETGWTPLSERRKLAKLSTMYKIHNNLVPEYLKNIFPSTRSLESNYNTRNREDYTIPKCRLELFKKSFVPDTINKWNSLSLITRNNSSFTSFKSSIQLNQIKPRPIFASARDDLTLYTQNLDITVS